MLYWYGVGLGLRSWRSGRFSREALKNVVIPVNYWRSVEYRLVFDELDVRASDRVLDVGSPKLLSLYLADRVGAQVCSTDIESYFVEDYATFAELTGATGRFRPLAVDGRQMDFDDGAFSRAFSISVLEHIPGDGDVRCIREIARTLEAGGRCALTVPFAATGRDEYRAPESFYWSDRSKPAADGRKVFFQRRYDERQLYERLIEPSGLSLRKLAFVGERLPTRRELGSLLPVATGPVQPLLSRAFHTRPSEGWRDLRKPLAALVVLEKPERGPGSSRGLSEAPSRRGRRPRPCRP